MEEMFDQNEDVSQEQHDEDSPETNFDEETIKVMQTVKESVPVNCDAVIILKPHESQTPIIFTQGHPYDTTAMTAQFIREMKARLINDLEA